MIEGSRPTYAHARCELNKLIHSSNFKLGTETNELFQFKEITTAERIPANELWVKL